MKSYDEYKDSGVDYLGSMPEEWILNRLKFYFRFVKGKAPKKTNPKSGLPYLTMEYLRNDELEDISYIRDYKTSVKVEDDDILILWDGSNAGEIVKSKTGILSSTMSKIIITQHDKDYAFYLLKSIERFIKDNTIGMGIPHVDSKLLDELYVLLPHKFQQQKIASFLDKKTTAINSIIEKKEKLIEKLESYKKSVITEAVTKGKLGDKYINEEGELVDEIEMKDSGVEWLGDIPNHWIFGDMKYQLSNNDGGVWGKDVENEDEGTYVIRSTEITIDGNWNLSNPMKRNLDESESSKCKLFKGDIVITKSSGSPDHIGKSVIVNEEVENLNCCYSNFVQRIRFKKYNSKLYHYILNSYVVREQYRYLTQSTTGLGNLNGSTLNEVQLPFIPLPEQSKIVSFLDKKTKKIDDIINETKQSIKKYKAYKKSLIYEAVTGKIDLRDYDEGGNSNVNANNS